MLYMPDLLLLSCLVLPRQVTVQLFHDSVWNTSWQNYSLFFLYGTSLWSLSISGFDKCNNQKTGRQNLAINSSPETSRSFEYCPARGDEVNNFHLDLGFHFLHASDVFLNRLKSLKKKTILKQKYAMEHLWQLIFSFRRYYLYDCFQQNFNQPSLVTWTNFY